MSRCECLTRAAALQFPARHPAVTAVVSGAGTVRSVRDTFTQRSVAVPDELWARLDALAAHDEDWARP